MAVVAGGMATGGAAAGFRTAGAEATRASGGERLAGAGTATAVVVEGVADGAGAGAGAAAESAGVVGRSAHATSNNATSDAAAIAITRPR
jgi:hypothetical protein